MAEVSGAALENANVTGPEMAPTVAETVPFRAEVVIRNPYDRAIRIERIDSTCTCTRLEPGVRFLLPHATTTLAVEVDNRGKSGLQHVEASVFVTDPEFEPIEVHLWWKVLGDVTVDAIAPLADPKERPADRAWRDIARFVQHERPDELNRLLKRIRLGSDAPPEGGLRLLGVDYAGDVWAFTMTDQGNGSWLVVATARTPDAVIAEGTRDEVVVIRTNHPAKPIVKLTFTAIIDRKAGQEAVDPMALPLPFPMP